MATKRIGVTQASKLIGVSPHRVRQLCREQRLDNIRNNRGFFRITESSCKAYAPMRTTVEHRKMVIYCNAQLEAEIRELLEEKKATATARFAYANVYIPKKKK